jgi:hypothetical protein
MRALNNNSLLDTYEAKYPESSSHSQIGNQHHHHLVEAQHAGANIISGTYINSSIIVHNPGA